MRGYLTAEEFSVFKAQTLFNSFFIAIITICPLWVLNLHVGLWAVYLAKWEPTWYLFRIVPIYKRRDTMNERAL